MSTPSPTSYTLERATDADRDWLFALYETTMRGIIDDAVGWNDHAQQIRFDESYRVSQFELVIQNEVRVGALYRAAHQNRLHISLILILPPHQGRSLGTHIIENSQPHCLEQDSTLTLSTFKNNPALRLYQRLGFEVTGEDEHFFDMTWKPQL
ncbi:uncharacterized protein METZ01_LOCUS412080 [marine metagenome]|uniref:N-acetyltransferase domain-containing protein n=1 Tax=marine metagenome TaxID=408172 RepID=A0A382WJW0_9ZZZZ